MLSDKEEGVKVGVPPIIICSHAVTVTGSGTGHANGLHVVFN